MNSTAVYDLIKARRDYLMAHKPEAKGEKYRQYIDPIRHACLEHCMKVKGIRIMRAEDTSAFFSAAPKFWGGRSGEIDSTISLWIDTIWDIEQGWFSALDCGDADEDWTYVTSIYEQLLKMLEYTEETFGEFEIPELDELC